MRLLSFFLSPYAPVLVSPGRVAFLFTDRCAQGCAHRSQDAVPSENKKAAHPGRDLERSKSSGYTLIEILVVLLIISIVTSVALLSIRHNDNKRMESIASELTQLFMLAEEQAMLQPATYGIFIENKTVQFTQLQRAEKNVTWEPLQDHVFKPQTMPNDIELQLKIKNAEATQATNNQPQLIISQNGDVTPFTIYIGKQGEKPAYQVVGHADGSVVFNALH